MSRWRDIKQNKVIKEEQVIVEKKDEITCAPILSRIKAFITDTFLITTPIFYIVIYLIMGSGETFSLYRVEGWGLILIIHLAIILAFWLKTGQTPGMKAYNIKVINNKTKNRISIFSGIIRYFILLLCIISIFGLFTIYFRKDNKTFQDIFSNTSIIEIDS
ncbi:MAG: RDD family protein [Arcobacter sp.]|nr:RDD family protein [Arcobacter sp.]